MNPDSLLPNGTVIEIKGTRYMIDDSYLDEYTQMCEPNAAAVREVAAQMRERIEKEMYATLFGSDGQAIPCVPAPIVRQQMTTRFKTIRFELDSLPILPVYSLHESRNSSRFN